jgi:hypothetical protein
MRAEGPVRGLTLVATITAVSCSIGPNFRNSWERFAEVIRPHVANDQPAGPGEVVFSRIASSLDPMLDGQSIRWAGLEVSSAAGLFGFQVFDAKPLLK